MKRFVLAICFALCANQAWAIATLDTKFQKGFTTNINSPQSFVSNAGTVAGTVGTCANPVLVMALTLKHGANAPSAVGMTWNGVSGTAMGSVFSVAVSGSKTHKLYLFYLLNPATGNQTLAASWTAAGVMDTANLSAWSLCNVNQSLIFQNVTTNTATGTGETITVTSAPGNMILTSHTDDNASAGISSPVGTLDWTELTLSGNYEAMHQSSTTTSTTNSGTIGSSVIWGILGVDMIAAPAGVRKPIAFE